ncbi:UNKNOWN [Stylonychia lemnae]|uniref:Uncharacterized protein n=1 Tax=Stylonychia lemnae TaxID=5949 RepID=A0A077ZX96_STYLE|nr:UNKNOWN [Stylonychia lemnae]|eukprot:CDW74515.1 UNKNOWN [Stylonychia lemnae]
MNENGLRQSANSKDTQIIHIIQITPQDDAEYFNLPVLNQQDLKLVQEKEFSRANINNKDGIEDSWDIEDNDLQMIDECYSPSLPTLFTKESHLSSQKGSVHSSPDHGKFNSFVMEDHQSNSFLGSGTIQSKMNLLDKGIEYEIDYNQEDHYEENNSIYKQNNIMRNRYSFDYQSKNKLNMLEQIDDNNSEDKLSCSDPIDVKSISIGAGKKSSQKLKLKLNEQTPYFKQIEEANNQQQDQVFNFLSSSSKNFRYDFMTPKFAEHNKPEEISEKQEQASEVRADTLFFENQELKFIFKNEKEKQLFFDSYEKVVLLYNRFELFGFDNDGSSHSSDQELFERKKTLIIADIHKFLVFIRETKQYRSDIEISSKMNPNANNQYDISVKEMVQRLILNYLERQCDLEGKLFTLKLYSKDCIKSTLIEHIKLRNLNLIINENIENRKPENIVVVGVGCEEMVNILKNYVPSKPFDGKKRDSVLRYLSDYLINKIFPATDVKEVIQKDMWSLIKIKRSHKLTL